ncbi:MAG: DUF3862 domain-containing protein [Methylobacterium sp.]|uniref:DUF3862 domain-containing protein n=1 Tax=Methylobacterium sp. TaxID=409 RepID=UPI00271D6475|nr:DUF3862 domain-containing protein [Methylobacterium sp.]MDO9429254.1 DUF3862 domain-containing protein [Methylobacterium sp.]
MHNDRPVILMAALLMVGCVATGAQAKECRATRSAYDRIETGMSMARVRTIFGCEGRQITHMTIGATRRATYSWRGAGRYGANVTLTFRNGRLTRKAQLGL